jgi:agmatinase
MAGLEGDSWKAKVDRSTDPKRDAGPIHLQRYQATPAYAGIPTFMGVPICLTQQDLKAGKVDVAILGAPVDMSSGQRGAAFGPRYWFAVRGRSFSCPPARSSR